MKPILCKVVLFCAVVGVPLRAGPPDGNASFIGPMHTIKAHSSTVPSNGDVNPYGVAVVPHGGGKLRDDHVLVSNFNNTVSG
jgi:hypothetical protein